ncbi:MAG: efflux RND transporter periplasmic adaptor subunit, partial [Verrucomicrobia bacterium]|nr:efflux RND transporter periplasmic adaptor subunit [Verrucomicrobiota bacterium]
MTDSSDPSSASVPVSTAGRAGCLILALAALGAGGWWWWSEVMTRNETAAAISAAGATPGTTPGAASGATPSTAPTASAAGGAPKAAAAPGAGRRALAMPVTVAKAVREDMEEWLTVPGTVTPLRIVTVRSRVDGELMRVNFREGQPVKAGEVLAEIDPRPFEVALERARAALQRNEALLANAKADLDRYEVLLKQDSIARQQVDTQAALVRQYEAALATDRASIANAELDLTYTKITSPLDGRAGLRLVDEGNMVRSLSEQGLVVITQEDPAGLLFSIPQDRAAAVRQRLAAGEAVSVRVSESEE